MVKSKPKSALGKFNTAAKREKKELSELKKKHSNVYTSRADTGETVGASDIVRNEGESAENFAKRRQAFANMQRIKARRTQQTGKAKHSIDDLKAFAKGSNLMAKWSKKNK